MGRRLRLIARECVVRTDSWASASSETAMAADCRRHAPGAGIAKSLATP
jgi:hypothetical protein